MSYGAKMLNTAFVTGQDGPRPKDIDLREECSEFRSALKGNSVPIIISETQIDDMPVPLLKVTSVLSGTLIKNDTIELPATVSSHAVYILVSYLKDLTKATKTFNIHLRGEDETTATALDVCHAAEVLGMDKYVSNLVPKLDAIYHNMPSYEQLEAVILHPAGKTRFYKIAVKNFAQRIRLGQIPDADDFNEYLEFHTGFADDIKAAIEKQEKWISAQEKREKREQKRVEAAEKAEQKAADFAKREKEIQAEEKQFWAAKKANDVKMRQSVETKLRASGRARKFTSDEHAWYVKTHGKQPPKGC